VNSLSAAEARPAVAESGDNRFSNTYLRLKKKLERSFGKAMPPKLVSDNGEHVVIRPLAYCTEAEITRFARAMDFPIIPCNLCGSQENAQRRQIKAMLQGWAREHPGRIESIATALGQVVPSHLADTSLFDFRSLTRDTAVAEGDTAFDPPELPSGLGMIRVVGDSACGEP
jgi:tRNA 2-thiocytidine biosynthesis protein TtcA